MQSTHSLPMQLAGLQSPPCRSPSFGAAVNQQPMAEECAPVARDQSAVGGPSSKLGRLVGKKASRLKELLLQNLGRAERTHDELFAIYEENFYRQQAQAVRLHKEFRAYAAALKGSHEASRSLGACVQQATGEYQSARHDLVCENLSQLEHLSDELMEKLREQVLAAIAEYLSKFGEMRDKIARRRRKLIDYDSARRGYESALAALTKRRAKVQQQQQQPAPHPNGSMRSLRSALALGGSSGELQLSGSAGQLVDEAKLLKLRDHYSYCKIMYETVNGELHEELPMIYEQKMRHLLATLQSYFALAAHFSSNAAKLHATLAEAVTELPAVALHAHRLRRRPSVRSDVRAKSEPEMQVGVPGASGSSGMGSSRDNSSMGSSSGSPTQEVGAEVHREPEDERPSDTERDDDDEDDDDSGREVEPAAPGDRQPEPGAGAEVAPPEPGDSADGQQAAPEEQSGAAQATAEVEPSECLYKVLTNYKYLAEDADELCFEPEEVIAVVPFESEREQEEGWLMGVRELNGQRGLFPANFTRPV